MSDDGFLTRWSRKKAEARRAGPAESPVAPHPDPLPAGGQREPVAAGSGTATEGQGGASPEPPPPTLDDVAALPDGGDIRRFLAPKVDEDVKRAALRKLFADPHFNVMDGLDTYIDDYNRSEPIPPSMLREMVQARMLGLFDDEQPPKASPDGAAPPAMPQSATDSPAVPPDEDPDLRLQQDDAAGPGGTGPGPAA